VQDTIRLFGFVTGFVGKKSFDWLLSQVDSNKQTKIVRTVKMSSAPDKYIGRGHLGPG
jgi:hypothetical protein